MRGAAAGCGAGGSAYWNHELLHVSQYTHPVDSFIHAAIKRVRLGSARICEKAARKLQALFAEHAVRGAALYRLRLAERAERLSLARPARAASPVGGTDPPSLDAASTEQGGAPTAPYASHRWSVFPGSAHDLVLGESEES